MATKTVTVTRAQFVHGPGRAAIQMLETRILGNGSTKNAPRGGTRVVSPLHRETPRQLRNPPPTKRAPELPMSFTPINPQS